jgi:hypothetical protein
MYFPMTIDARSLRRFASRVVIGTIIIPEVRP